MLAQPDRRILSPFVLAEIDHLLTHHGGQPAEMAMLRDVADGAYELAPFDASDVAAALRVIRQYDALTLGLADASIVVLAERYGCLDVLTLDQRHFRAVTTASGQSFRLLPFDQ